MSQPEWDVVVLGAGAAGLMAGLRAAEAGARVLVLEKNSRPGVKILMSGGTRCNLTHNCDDRGIVRAFGRNGQFLYSALAAFGVRDTIEFFENEGVATKVEAKGKVFPVSDKAIDVLQALLGRLERSGATIALCEPALDLTKGSDDFSVVSSKRIITTRNIVLTTGGQSYPASGTTGDGYRLGAAFGHTIVRPRPALTPITTNAAWVARLRGITLPDVTMTLAGENILQASCRGSLLFAHFGLSGPVALDLSRSISGYSKPAEMSLKIDLIPDISEARLNAELQSRSLTDGKKLLANVLSEYVPHRLAESVLELVGLPIDRKAAALLRTDRQGVTTLLKRLPVPITGTLGFAKAEVTTGGVSLDEVESKTMKSKLVSGLYLAGEVLDLDGPIGGYNFQAAWSTGWLAGMSAARQ